MSGLDPHSQFFDRKSFKEFREGTTGKFVGVGIEITQEDGLIRAFRTIGEVSASTGVAPHVLRYWETQFPLLKPMKRPDGRRYYRPDDVALVRRIHHLLADEGDLIREHMITHVVPYDDAPGFLRHLVKDRPEFLQIVFAHE